MGRGGLVVGVRDNCRDNFIFICNHFTVFMR